MKRAKVLVMLLSAALLLLSPSGCRSDRKGFSFRLQWNAGLESSYDSESGLLVKCRSAEKPEDYRTTLRLSRSVTEELRAAAEALDMSAYPDAPEAYDPYSPPDAGPRTWSKPAMGVTLTLRTPAGEKTVRCPSLPPDALQSGPEDAEVRPYDEAGEAFIALVRQILETVCSSEEWRSLPDFENGYQ